MIVINTQLSTTTQHNKLKTKLKYKQVGWNIRLIDASSEFKHIK